MLFVSAYELTGRIDPPAAVSIYLHGATAPFESSTASSADGRFRFHKLPSGTYTLVITTPARGEAVQTVELTPGTVDSKGHLDLVLRIDASHLESDGARTTGATVSATLLSVPDRARKEYDEAQRCLSRGDSDCASGRLHRAVEFAPQFAAAWNQLGTIAYQTRRYSDAEKALDKALELSTKPDEKDYVNFIAGSVYERQKKYDEAETYFRKVIASDPKNATALNYLGYMLADRGTRLDEALSLVRRAVALEPQNGAYLDSLGWVHFKMGKYDLAEANLRRALERIDNDPTVHEHLGDVYQKTNRLKLAVTQWERSLQEWKKTVPAEVEPGDVAKVQKKLDGAKVKLAKQEEAAK